MCLSYYDERKGNWTCEDECLTIPDKDSNLLCGQSNHLTNFALLLGGAGKGSEEPCHSQSLDYTLQWLSLAMVAAAIVIVGFGVLAIEVYIRYMQHKVNASLDRASSVIASRSSSGQQM